MADVIATLSAALNTISYLVREIDFIRASTFLLDVPKAEVLSLVDGLMVLVSLQFERVKCDYKDFGVMRALLLHTVFLQAQNVISRIRKHVIARPDDIGQACTLKDSYTTSFNMIAVAGAIVAQIAITAMSLEHLEQTHWTAAASFVVSLIAGLLSVYFACMVQYWNVLLSRSHREYLEDQLEATIIRVLQHQQGEVPSDELLEKRLREFQLRHIASYNSALLLVAPVQLLNWSLGSLLVGIGIYYGLTFTKNLSEMRGRSANLAILLVYTMFTAGALVSFILPNLYKLVEQPGWTDKEQISFEELLDEVRAAKKSKGDSVGSGDVLQETQDVPRDQSQRSLARKGPLSRRGGRP